MPHVVITGASSGIGEALARAYLTRGAHVTLVARRLELLEQLAAHAAPERVHLVRADLSDDAQALAWIEGSQQKLGPIDVLINNAGVQIVDHFTATEWPRAEAMIRLNLHTPLRLTQAVLPAMLARKSGCIVDVASMAALAPTPGMVFYSAVKAGLAAASESLRGELRGSGVHVLTVYPGPVSTPMEQRARAVLAPSAAARLTPTGRADVLARMVVRAVERRRARVIYPRIYALARHFPNLTRVLVDLLTPPVQNSAGARES
ncbi:MAG: SDR family NAD(P)-dependent oxidoreductase [Deltaproteobacteria bacterium]|nr:SDR family NAD(P)-dependent oxidoreductase [Deltaproteobacteria bacterium]